MKYKWLEMKAHLGLIFKYRSVRLYVAGAGWTLNRKDRKEEYLERENMETPLGKTEADFGSGLWTGGILGVELRISGNYTIGVESLLFNRNDYQIMIGISQTGSPRSKPMGD